MSRLKLYPLVVGVLCFWTAAVLAQEADPGSEQEKSESPDVKVTGGEQLRPGNPALQSPRTGDQAVATSTPTGDVTGQPAIRVQKPVHDFGQHWSGGKLRHDFVIRNGGDQVLRIQSVSSSCGCTVVPGYDKEIAPGQTGAVAAELDTLRVRNRFSKHLTVRCNDPVTPKVRLTIAGIVKPYVELDPPQISMGHAGEDQVVRGKARIINNTDEPLNLTMTESEEGPFSAKLVEKVEGKEYEVVVTATPPYQPKLNRTVFMLDSNLDKQKKVEVPVTLYVPPRLDVNPQYVILTRRIPKEQLRWLRFTNNGEKPVQVLSAHCDDERIQIEVDETEKGKEYNIQVRIPPDYEPPSSERTITLATDDPRRSKIEIPIKGRPRRTIPRANPAEELVGQQAPKVEWETVDGDKVQVGEASDQVLVLNFFTAWSSWSKRQLPAVAKLQRDKFADEPRVKFLGVSQDNLDVAGQRFPHQTPEQIAAMWKRAGVGFDYALDKEGIGPKQFKVQDYPTVMLIGRDGKVKAVHGARVDLRGVLEMQIRELLAGNELSASAAAGPTLRKRTAPNASRAERRQRVDRGG